MLGPDIMLLATHFFCKYPDGDGRRKMADGSGATDTTDYRLLDRRVIDEFNRFTEHERVTRRLIDWLGFRASVIPFRASERLHGTVAGQLDDLAGQIALARSAQDEDAAAAPGDQILGEVTPVLGGPMFGGAERSPGVQADGLRIINQPILFPNDVGGAFVSLSREQLQAVAGRRAADMLRQQVVGIEAA